MFKKPFKAQSCHLLKNSEARKLLSVLNEIFPNTSLEELNEKLVSSKEKIQKIKISDSHVIFYQKQPSTKSGSDSEGMQMGGNPLVIDIDGRGNLFPTVYALMKIPCMLSSFVIDPRVFQFIEGGADLMLPGVIFPEDNIELPPFRKGDKMCIKLLGSMMPVAVGICQVNSSEIQNREKKGKALQVVHFINDYLWKLGDQQISSISTDSSNAQIETHCQQQQQQQNHHHHQEEVVVVEEEEEEEHEREGVQSDKMTTNSNSANLMDRNTMEPIDTLSSCSGTTLPSPSYSKCSLEDPPSQKMKGEPLKPKENEDLQSDTKSVEDHEPNEMTKREEESTSFSLTSTQQSEDPIQEVSEMNDEELLEYCFLMAIKFKVKDSELPLLVSSFYSNQMLSVRPLGSNVDIKRSKYKKVSVFLKEMEARGLMVTSESSPGVFSITGINRQHNEYVHFRPNRKWHSSLGNDANREKEESELIITELFKPPSALLAIFIEFGAKEGQLFTVAEIRDLFAKYISQHQLTSNVDKKLVLLDRTLAIAIGNGLREGMEIEKKTLFEQLLARMQPFHELAKDGTSEIRQEKKMHNFLETQSNDFPR